LLGSGQEGLFWLFELPQVAPTVEQSLVPGPETFVQVLLTQDLCVGMVGWGVPHLVPRGKVIFEEHGV